MTHKYSHLRINEMRFKADFDTLAEFGATKQGGINRPAFNPAHLEACQWFHSRAKQAGLKTQVDGAGNYSAILPSKKSDSLTLLIGSHLDSVPNGGRFDGALGVIASLEVLRTIKEADIPMDINLESIVFMDEEGYYFSLLGSRALTGSLNKEELNRHIKCSEAFKKGLTNAGLSLSSILSAKRNPGNLLAYLELHIEQGPILNNGGHEIGIVSNIIGTRALKVHFIGRSDHAGTTPMDKRSDASLGAAFFTLQIQKYVSEKLPGCVATVGNMSFKPGVLNVIPGEVFVSLEFRAGSLNLLETMQTIFSRLASEAALNYKLITESELLENNPPVQMSPELQVKISNSCHILSLRQMLINSGAGHDAQILAQVCPAGMIFIPSEKGASHSALEFSRWEDCINGGNTLLQTCFSIDNGGEKNE